MRKFLRRALFSLITLAQVFSTLMTIVSFSRLSEQDKDLEILILRQQLDILQRKLDKPVKPKRSEKMTMAILAVTGYSTTCKSTARHYQSGEGPYQRWVDNAERAGILMMPGEAVRVAL